MGSIYRFGQYLNTTIERYFQCLALFYIRKLICWKIADLKWKIYFVNVTVHNEISFAVSFVPLTIIVNQSSLCVFDSYNFPAFQVTGFFDLNKAFQIIILLVSL